MPSVTLMPPITRQTGYPMETAARPQAVPAKAGTIFSIDHPVNEPERIGPASIKQTCHFPLAASRFASTQPADPAPTII